MLLLIIAGVTQALEQERLEYTLKINELKLGT
jgi:hypothetical protein